MAGGMAEAIKMAMTSDKELFGIFENFNKDDIDIETVILRSLMIKKKVVEEDEREGGLRKILNFGHTIGHGIESSSDLYHGECVALGLVPMCSEKIRPRVINVLKKCGLYNEVDFDWDRISRIMFHDKKADGDTVSVTMVNEIGKSEIKILKCSQVIEMAKSCLRG
jgi:3-dehydroquinate synthase